jgi:hypothetical protein
MTVTDGRAGHFPRPHIGRSFRGNGMQLPFKPSARSSRQSAPILQQWSVTRCAEPEAVVLRRNPITGIAGCCARAASGQAAAAPPSSVMKLLTSSARAESPGGTSGPSVLAVFKLIKNSNLVA